MGSAVPGERLGLSIVLVEKAADAAGRSGVERLPIKIKKM
jgi:hypothetical protein